MKEITVNAREKVLQKKVADPFPEHLKTIESFLDNLAFQKIILKKEEQYIIETNSMSNLNPY